MPGKKYIYADVKRIIKNKGGVLLSLKKEYKNTHSIIKIKCLKCQHVWKTGFYCINTNHTWCQKCIGKLKYTIDDVKKIINEKNGILLSTEYKNSYSKLKIKCNKCDWVWEPKLMSILNSKSWCPKCAGNARYTIDDVRREIKKRNGTLLSKKYINNRTKLKIKCLKCNTAWMAIFDSVKRNRWCPNCSIRKSEKTLFKIVKDIFPTYNIESNFKGFKWLKNKKTGGYQEIDIFVFNNDKSFSLAIEYDGKQHYAPVRFGGMSQEKAEKEFIKVKKRDRRKNYLMKKHKEDVKYFIRFNYKDKLIMEMVCQKLKKVGAK